MRGKTVIVYFEEDLLPNTTYTVDLTGAIADNNEGNMFPGFTTVFSTGDSIDSMYITGLVQDCNTLMPIKGATVMLYKDQRDSAVFLERPVAAVKTDDWGYFALQNIQDTVFRVYAIVDGYRAMYEANNVGHKGLLIWMSHSAWPSLAWQTYDYWFRPTAACAAVKKACEPLHIQMNPATCQIEVVNARFALRH